jgi:hypothetical protein
VIFLVVSVSRRGQIQRVTFPPRQSQQSLLTFSRLGIIVSPIGIIVSPIGITDIFKMSIMPVGYYFFNPFLMDFVVDARLVTNQ